MSDKMTRSRSYSFKAGQAVSIRNLKRFLGDDEDGTVKFKVSQIPCDRSPSITYTTVELIIEEEIELS